MLSLIYYYAKAVPEMIYDENTLFISSRNVRTLDVIELSMCILEQVFEL